MKSQTTTTGMNRTGVAMSPLDSKVLVEGARNAPPSSAGSELDLDVLRRDYGAGGEKIGSIPPPATAKGAVVAAAKGVLQGERVSILLDKMGERLGFERTGSRLYESLISKARQAGELPGGPTLAELQQIHDEEMAHFAMLQKAVVKMGGDPTVVTPAADVSAVASMGIGQVLNDPRTTLPQCLNAILIAELVDNDAWALLIELAEALGQDDLVARFQKAQADEAKHLANVRRWVTALTLNEGAPAKANA